MLVMICRAVGGRTENYSEATDKTNETFFDSRPASGESVRLNMLKSSEYMAGSKPFQKKNWGLTDSMRSGETHRF